MMMTIESFVLYNIVMWTVGWYLLKRHGEKEYGEGIIDAVNMHYTGQLTYTPMLDGDLEMLNIKIKPDEEYEE